MSTQTFTQMTRADQVGHVAAGLASASSVSANVVNTGALVLAHEGLELQTISGTVTLSDATTPVTVKDAAGADIELASDLLIVAASVDGTVANSSFSFTLKNDTKTLMAGGSIVPAHAGSVLNILGGSASDTGIESTAGPITLTPSSGTKGDKLVVTLTVIDISA